MRTIVIGFEGSPGAADALRWAHREAALHDATLTAVMAWSYLGQLHADPDADFDVDYDEENARATLDTFLERVLGAEDAAGVERHEVSDVTARGLLDAAEGADLLVVGARGLGGFKGMLLGSVSQHCLHHATGPLAIIRPQAGDHAPRNRIVVGTDGSEDAAPALRWALEEGRRRNATVTVLHAWHMPYIGGSPWVVGSLDSELFEKTAFGVIDTALADQDTSGLPAPVHQRVVHGSAASALLDAAEEADLVVVGSRGLGGFTGLLLGSVSQQVARHATCPVVVVPTPRD
ncbi:MAG TPA: universal stress protein [Acidimicrobiales bacterium]|nr:universal stress protein [Acidimicrobiales bacterium]